MSTVRALLEKIQQSEVYQIEPEATVFDALKLMRDRQIGALLVMKKGRFSGIVTERDYAQKVELEERTAEGTLVEEIMTPTANVHTVTPFTTLEECLALMDTKHVRHLPVFENQNVLGILSIRDVTHGIVDYQVWMAQQFQGYMSGRT